MKKGTSTFLVGIIVGIVFSILAVIFILPKQIFIEQESTLGFDETVETIQMSAKEHEWGIPNTYDLQATLKKKGFDVEPIKVFSLCKPEHAYQILSGKEERLASALMPCRIAVYERDGKTYVSMLNSGLFSKIMGGKIKTVMSAATAENALILEPVIKK